MEQKIKLRKLGKPESLSLLGSVFNDKEIINKNLGYSKIFVLKYALQRYIDLVKIIDEANIPDVNISDYTNHIFSEMMRFQYSEQKKDLYENSSNFIIELKNTDVFNDSMETRKYIKEVDFNDYLTQEYLPLHNCPFDLRKCPEIKDEFMEKLKDLVEKIYMAFVLPDISFSEYSAQFNEAIIKAKQQVQRCDKAFDIINQSMDQFQTDFPKYYEKAALTGNSTIIISDFITDLKEKTKKNTKNSIKIQWQFMKVLNYFTSQAHMAASQGCSQLTPILNMLGS